MRKKAHHIRHVLANRAKAFLTLLFAALWLVGMPATAQENRTERLVRQALKLTPRTTEGAKLFAERCAKCHGPEGHGDGREVIPAVAGQLKGYIVKQLADMAEAYRPAAEMHRLVASAELSRPQSLADIASHLGSLPRMAKPELGDGRDLATGKRIYNSGCAQCHGFDAQGDSATMVPALQGQHYSYLLMQARQMPVSHGSSLSVETMERFEDLTLEQLAAVSDYISRIRVARAADPVVRGR